MSEGKSKPKNHDPKINPVKSQELAFLNEEVLEESAFSEEENESLSCGVCGETFSTITSLNIHSKLEHWVAYTVDDGESEHGIVEEGEVALIASAKYEVRDNEVDDSVNCNKCKKKFSTKTALNNHMMFEHTNVGSTKLEDEEEQMEILEEEYEEEDEAMVDVKTNEEQKETICCRICLKKFVTTAALNNHAMIDHTDVYAAGDAEAWTWELSELDEFYKRKRDKISNLMRKETHFIKEEAVLSALAPEPLVILANPEVQYVIMKDDGTEKLPKPRVKKKYYTPKGRNSSSGQDDNNVCSECNKAFESKAKLITHQNYVHQSKSIVCEMCGKTFQSNSAMRYHRREHTGEKPFLCSDCPRTFMTQSLMKIHHFRHHQYKPHQCDVCRKRFTTQKEMKEHRSMHILEKPFACEFCPLKFNQQQSLMIHLSFAHEKKGKERPHYCQKCGKIFNSLQSLNLHMSVDHPTPIFNCQQCPRKFNKESSLKTHVLTIHEKSKVFVCKICDKTFNNVDLLQLHKSKVHQSKKNSNYNVVVEANVEEFSETSDE